MIFLFFVISFAKLLPTPSVILENNTTNVVKSSELDQCICDI